VETDLLVVCVAESTPLPDGGHAHAGMLEAARWLLDHECVQLAELMRANPGYQLKVSLHSAMEKFESCVAGLSPLPPPLRNGDTPLGA
jgi:hypothetical protein